MKRDIIPIPNTHYWYKVVDFLQQNWAVIEHGPDKTTVFFFHDGAGVFDSMDFPDEAIARRELRWNGFAPYDSADEETKLAIPKPEPPFYKATHPNGRIYSSKRFWKTPPERRRKGC